MGEISKLASDKRKWRRKNKPPEEQLERFTQKKPASLHFMVPSQLSDIELAMFNDLDLGLSFTSHKIYSHSVKEENCLIRMACSHRLH